MKQALNKEQLREKTLELRRSNIVIGNQTQDYLTQNNVNYNDKGISKTRLS